MLILWRPFFWGLQCINLKTENKVKTWWMFSPAWTDSPPGLGEQSWWGIIRERPNFIWGREETCRGVSYWVMLRSLFHFLLYTGSCPQKHVMSVITHNARRPPFPLLSMDPVMVRTHTQTQTACVIVYLVVHHSSHLASFPGRLTILLTRAMSSSSSFFLWMESASLRECSSCPGVTVTHIYVVVSREFS